MHHRRILPAVNKMDEGSNPGYRDLCKFQTAVEGNRLVRVRSDPESCTEATPTVTVGTPEAPQQNWQFAVAPTQTDAQSNIQPALVAFPGGQAHRQPSQHITLDPRRTQLAQHSRANIWHTTALPGGTQAMPQLPSFLNFNNNASTSLPTAPSAGMDYIPVQRPGVGLVQQVMEVFKHSELKEMLPSQVYTEMEKMFPYYKHITGQKRKSWMSSVRHALTTPRFKSRKTPADDTSRSRRGCLWSLNEDFDENAPLTPTPRKRRAPVGASRRKQAFLGKTRDEFTTPLFHMNRNTPTFFQPQHHMPQRYSFWDMPNSSNMQTTFSPGPTGPVHGNSNMYYQPFSSPAVGYVIAGQKLGMPQPAMQPMNMGQWNVSGFSPCNQQHMMANNSGFCGTNNGMMNSNQNNSGQSFGPSLMQALQQQQQHTKQTSTSLPVSHGGALQETQPLTQQPHPTPISIQAANFQQDQSHLIEDNDQDVQEVGEERSEAQDGSGLLSSPSESQVHDAIKKELRDLVYQSLDMCNAEDLRSDQEDLRSDPEPVVETTSTQTVHQNNPQPLQVNRSPTWVKSRPPHFAQGGFHNLAWSPLSHTQSLGHRTPQPAFDPQEPEEAQPVQDHGDMGKNLTQSPAMAEFSEPEVGQASISNDSLDVNDNSD